MIGKILSLRGEYEQLPAVDSFYRVVRETKCTLIAVSVGSGREARFDKTSLRVYDRGMSRDYRPCARLANEEEMAALAAWYVEQAAKEKTEVALDLAFREAFQTRLAAMTGSELRSFRRLVEGMR